MSAKLAPVIDSNWLPSGRAFTTTLNVTGSVEARKFSSASQVTETVVSPAPTAVITPSSETVATDSFSDTKIMSVGYLLPRLSAAVSPSQSSTSAKLGS